MSRERMFMRKYKVIVWGLGSVGRYAIKMIGQKKSLELVAAVDVDENKIGKDAGELFGFKHIGVSVTNDIDAALMLDADVVLVYLPNMRDQGNMRPSGFTPNVRNICKALEAKKNVISTLPVYAMKTSVPELYTMVNDTAIANGVTYTQQGIFPGLFTPYLPTVIASMAGNVERLIVNGGQDDSFNTSPWVQVFGYGKQVSDYNADLIKDIITSYYGPTVVEIAERLGLEYDEYVEEHNIFTTDIALNPPCGVVAKGTISAHEFVMKCVKGDVEITGFHFVHKVCDDIQPIPAMKDSYEIYGEPNLEVTIKGMIPGVESFATSTAPSVNLIPQVVASKPGFVDALDLPASKPIL